MPTVEQILAGLKQTVNTLRPVAILWHVYFAILVILLLLGRRPSKRTAGILLILPLLSVSIIAWSSLNPFNGIVYALISALLLYFTFKLPREKIRLAPLWAMIPGILLIIFGWIYPHFLNTSSFITYLYAAPIGLIPCATLSIVIGFALVLNGLNSRSFSLTLGFAGIFYGLTGVAQLGVLIDIILLIGAILTVVFSFIRRYHTSQ